MHGRFHGCTKQSRPQSTDRTRGLSHHWGNRGSVHHMLGSMSELLGAAGAGALDAKFCGKKDGAQNAPPLGSANRHPACRDEIQCTSAYLWTNESSTSVGRTARSRLWGIWKTRCWMSCRCSGGLALGKASHLLHHCDQNGAPVPSIGGGGFGSLMNCFSTLHP